MCSIDLYTIRSYLLTIILRQEMTCIEKYHKILFKKMQQKPAEPGVYTAAVVQWLQRSPLKREVVASIPDRVIPKTL